MKFYQVAAAVLIFRLFDLSFEVAASTTQSSAPIVIAAVGVLIWLVLSLLVWLVLREIDRSVVRHGARND